MSDEPQLRLHHLTKDEKTARPETSAVVFFGDGEDAVEVLSINQNTAGLIGPNWRPMALAAMRRLGWTPGVTPAGFRQILEQDMPPHIAKELEQSRTALGLDEEG